MGAQEGREGVEAEWERSDAFHEAWKLKARDMLARAEWRRRKLTKRVRACPACCLFIVGGHGGMLFRVVALHLAW